MSFQIRSNITHLNIADALPIPVVDYQKNFNLEKIEHTEQLWDMIDTLSFIYAKEYRENLVPSKPVQWLPYDGDNNQAENNALNEIDAERLVQEILKNILLQFPDSSVSLYEKFVTSKFYILKDIAELDNFIPKEENAYTDFGNYFFNYAQTYNNIPCLPTNISYFSFNTSNPRPYLYAAVELATEKDYAVTVSLSEFIKNAHEDVPLADFSSLLNTLDELMSLGYLFDISALEFRYALADNQDDLGNSYLLVPIWVVYGKAVQEADMPFPETVEEYPSAHAIQSRFAIHAQTLRIYGYDFLNKDNASIPVLTWENVQ